ncbi:MAG: hypothetical protein O9972_48870 [Burkholderiales bacterium]|nr:hypothetical protein [Burkholderiales bacterium]
MFDVVMHADWSLSPKKRWFARADRIGAGYLLGAPSLVGERPAFLADAATSGRTTLIGFDFPIGLPEAYGRAMGFSDFREALHALGAGDWAQWFDVATDRTEISIRRPFYPMAPGGRKRAHLLDALGVTTTDELRRLCERATMTRRAACPLFWTLGGNQVGKAAITGWREIVRPALRDHQAQLWPFDGGLRDLSHRSAIVIAETYPAESYRHVGARFKAGMSKRAQADRMTLAPSVETWAARRGHELSPDLRDELSDGFGAGADGEDRFDAVLGLCGMVEVISSRRAEGAPDTDAVRRWEGWILGQQG